MEMEKTRKTPKVIMGTVCGTSMQKSAVLRIDYIEKHPLYKKYIKKTKKIVFHDENEQCALGDRVTIMQTRPLSKRKRHRLVEIVEKAE